MDDDLPVDRRPMTIADVAARDETAALKDRHSRCVARLTEALSEVDALQAHVEVHRAALQAIRALWTHPASAQRQDVAFQRAVRIASVALGVYEDPHGFYGQGIDG